MGIEQDYQTAQTGAVMMDASAWGRLRFTGTSRLDFLHRMSPNDVAKLQPGQGAATIFTTPIARIIDRTILYPREDDVLMVTSRGNQGRVQQWLRKYIFFNDDVQVKDVTAETAMISLYGPNVGQVLEHMIGDSHAGLRVHHWRFHAVANRQVMLARAVQLVKGGCFHLIFDRAAFDVIWQILIEAGVTPIDEDTYQVLRVEAGQPEFGRELGEEYIPLEANLWPDVSFTKGCYTGQEIIARMESRQRLAKHLVGLRFDAEVILPATLVADGHEAGVVTSVVHSPRLGWIGLGYVKANHGGDDQVVESRSGDQRVPTRLAGLPLKNSSA